jgi:hypothetical protein
MEGEEFVDSRFIVSAQDGDESSAPCPGKQPKLSIQEETWKFPEEESNRGRPARSAVTELTELVLIQLFLVGYLTMRSVS